MAGRRRRRHLVENVALTVAALLAVVGIGLVVRYWYVTRPAYQVAHTIPANRWIGPAIAPRYAPVHRNT